VVEIYQGLRQNYENFPMGLGPTARNPIWRIGLRLHHLALDKGYRRALNQLRPRLNPHQLRQHSGEGDVTRESLLDGFRKRHVYAATDEILADVGAGTTWQETNSPPLPYPP